MRTLTCLWLACLLTGSTSAQVVLPSPDGQLVATLTPNAKGQLAYSVRFQGREVLAPSPLGVTVSGVQFGAGDELVKARQGRFREKFPWRGNQPQIELRGRSAEVSLKNPCGVTWRVELRCFNNAVAWRAVVPGSGPRKLAGEPSAWVFPAGTIAWCNPSTANYEGIYERWLVKEAPSARFTNGIGMPVTLELPGGGFAVLSEAGEMGYSGMTLEPTGSWMLKSSFRDDPEGWEMEDEVHTPWRVLMVAADLNGLVHCGDVIPALCPAPDKKLFPKGSRTDYLKPGRCLWQWWAYNDAGTHWSKQHWFVDQAAALHCTYYLVDEGWEHSRQQWASDGKTAWQRMKELCDYAAGRGVGIWVWKGWDYRPERQWEGLETPDKREAFFRHCAEAGVKGAKIDFMDSESHDRLAFYQACLRTAAKYHIMLDFHGANKPAGEERTWPNEMTREAVRGLEWNKWSTLPPQHYATLPFTRYVVGPADFTPTTLQAPFLKGTTVAQQLACAVVFTSPILCWADKPDLYLNSPVAELIRTLPPVWDETRVLPGSRIGDLAILARRSGKTWYVGILNGGEARTGSLEFSFLGRGRFSADFFGDAPEQPTEFAIERWVAVSASTSRPFRLNAGGGLVVRIQPAGARVSGSTAH